jgi:hypothetical protein
MSVAKEIVMRAVALSVAIGAVLIGGGAHAETTGPAAQAKCRRAEINPVTGHVFCFEPRGAPVEAPPEEIKRPCKDDDARGQWSYGPNCTPVPEGM